MEDSDSGGLISTEEDQSGVDSSGSSGHARMEKKISRLKMKLLGFQEVVEERDSLRQDIQTLEGQIEELIREKEQRNTEHAQELAVLSSSFTEHLNKASAQQDSANDPSCVGVKVEFEKEIQKLRATIEDKNYHIGNLQKKLLEAQLELEHELDKHEEETEGLRAQLGSNEMDFDKLVEDRLTEVRSQYEKELEELRARIEIDEERTVDGSSDAEARGENDDKENHEKLKHGVEGKLEGDLEQLLEKERTKYRVEIMAVKDRLNHQHQVELDDLITKLEQSNAENEVLRERLREEKLNGSKDHLDEKNTINNGEVENGAPLEDDFAKKKPANVVIHDVHGDVAGMEELRSQLHAHYQKEIEQVAKRLSDEYQGELDESLGKMEEEWEQQLERQKNEYEERIAALQRQLKSQYQNLEQVTADMEEQIQTLRDSHSQEVRELLGRLREASEERRRSVMQQDTTEQQVVIIKEEHRSKVESLEQELRAEKDKVAEYQRQMDAVEAQVQAFKAEKEQELKMIEEELRRQCKALVEKKGNELKERYQCELNEKLNNVEQHWRKMYEEDLGKTRSELEESNKTLKDKYEREVSDIMVQMDEVHQRSREVLLQEKMQFEAQQKEEFERQLSEVKEELQPYKDKYLELERENRSLSEKYELDLSELKNKMTEVEGRYKADKSTEEETLLTLKSELELYKNKLQELQEGKKSLMDNYEAQIANLKKKFEDMEEGEIKTLQEEVNVYIRKAANLEEEKKALMEKYSSETGHLKSNIESKDDEIVILEDQKRVLSETKLELEHNLESLKTAYAELEQKQQMDNKIAAEVERLKAKTTDQEKELEDYKNTCNKLQEAKRSSDNKHIEELENLKSTLDEKRSENQTREEQLHFATKERERLDEELREVRNELEQLQTKHLDLEVASNKVKEEHFNEVSLLQRESSEERERDQELFAVEKQRLEKRVQDLEQELQYSEKRFESLELRKEVTDEQNTADIESLMSELNILRNLSAEVEQLRKLEKEKENYEAEVSRLKGEIDSLTAKVKDLQDNGSGSTREIDGLQKELEDLRAARITGDFEEEKQKYQEEIDFLKEQKEEQLRIIQELEEEGHNKFGVLMSQHEKELENLKLELEEQIARKREQLSRDSAAKRQRLKDEYEGKLRVVYEELVTEKTRIKELMKLNDDLSRKLSSSQEESDVLTEEIDRLKEIEEGFTAKEEKLAEEHAAKMEQIVAEYDEKVRSLEERIATIETKEGDEDSSKGENEKEREQSLKEYKEKLESLESELSSTRQETIRLTDEVKIVEERNKTEISNLIATYEEKLKKSEGQIQQIVARLEESDKDHTENIISKESEKETLQQQLNDVSRENEKLQTMVKHLDSAKQAVVHMYDEKIESLVSELEEVSERANLAEENLKESREKFAVKQEKFEKDITELRDANERLLKEHGSAMHSLEDTIDSEGQTRISLQQRIDELLQELSSEKVRLEGNVEAVSAEKQQLEDEFKAKIRVFENELHREKNENAAVKQTLEERKEELNQHVTKVRELNGIVEEKKSTILEREQTIKEITSKLDQEVEKASTLEKEMRALFENQSSEYVHSLERIRNDLKQEYEENKEQLKKNYENIFAKMEEDHRVSREEFEAEVESLKGMVENLEQLSQLKDEEREVLITDLATKHGALVEVLEKGFEKEKNDLEKKVIDVNKELDETKVEKESLLERHKVDLVELESRLQNQHRSELENVVQEVDVVRQEKKQIKEELEKEIETLKDQLTFETDFQADLQGQHDKEMRNQRESLESEHKRQIELLNETLQERIQELKTTNEASETEIGELNFKLEESQLELGVLKEVYANQREEEVKNLKKLLQEKIQEYEDLKEQTSVEMVQQQSQVETLSCGKDTFPNREEEENMKLSYEVMLASLRVENKELSDQVQSLKEEIDHTVTAHQQQIEFTKSELERQYKQREDRINKKHSEELSKLMEKLEDLLQQENASKTLTEEHMQDIGTLRAEFDHKFQRLLREKRDEMDEFKRNLEQQYKVQIAEHQELIKQKDQDISDLQNDVKSLLSRIDAAKNESLTQQQGISKAKEELSKLRRENTDLYRKLREEIEKSRGTYTAAGLKTMEQLQMENGRLKREIENLKNLLSGSSLMNGVGESNPYQEGSHVLQLIKLMEQLMKEKNALELKLRQEILDLKSRFGVLGDTTNTSLNSSSILSFSLSPEKHLSRDGLVEMMQELRENKWKQEEDIKSHVQETENMIREIKRMMDSAEFTDRRLQEMLHSQWDHLEQQRRVLVQRLWQLRDQHKAVEQKIARQLNGTTSSLSSSNDDSARSKYYQSIIEENLKREKELLALKRQQVEDLNMRIAREKLSLEKHSKEKQNLEREMVEKDKLESELSTQRRDLERKWLGSLKEKEFQLKREKEILDESKRRDEVDNILLRGGTSAVRPTERKVFGDTRPQVRFPPTSILQRQVEPYKIESDKITEKKGHLSGSFKRTTSPVTYKQCGDFTAHGGKQLLDPSVGSGQNEQWSYRNSKRSSNKKKEPTKTKRAEVQVPRLDLSSDDSDVDLGIANDASSWEVGLEEDESDLELYGTQCINGFENFEGDWERKLEEELKRISGSGALHAAKAYTDEEKTINRQKQTSQDGPLNDEIKKSKLASLDKAPITQYSSKVDLEWLRKLSFDYIHPNTSNPRTSTANGTNDNPGQLSLSSILRTTSDVASPPIEPASRHINREQDLGFKARGPRVSHFAADSSFPLRRASSKESGIDSPPSARSEPAISGRMMVNSRRRSLRNERISGVYLLNVDEYVDRHKVRSSEEVAKIRDLSPSEKRFDL